VWRGCPAALKIYRTIAAGLRQPWHSEHLVWYWCSGCHCGQKAVSEIPLSGTVVKESGGNDGPDASGIRNPVVTLLAVTPQCSQMSFDISYGISYCLKE
jgi:hypothetical protein